MAQGRVGDDKRTALVGRAREMAFLAERLAGAGESHGCAVVVLGEPGMGKSRLVEEFARLASEKGVRLLSGSAVQGLGEPYLPFKRALAGTKGEGLLSSDEHAGFTQVMAFDSGLAVAFESGGEGAGSTANVASVVQGFIQDSFSQSADGSGRFEFGDCVLFTERAGPLTVAALLSGEDQPGMRGAVRRAAVEVASGVACSDALSRLAKERFAVRRRLEGVRLEGERIRIAERVTAHLESLSSEGPVAVVLEDMHWADESTLHLLRYAARNLKGSRMMLIAAARPDEGAGKVLAKLKDDGLAEAVDLGRMDPGDVKNLVASVCSPNAFPADFFGRIGERCGGNPLFVLELVRQMVSDGNIARKDGTCVLLNEGVALPASLGEVVSRRLAGLGQEEMALAEYASCEGREFDLRAVRGAPGVADADEALARLVESGFVSRGGDACVFTHALFQDALYAGITARWKAAHHRSLGEHWEEASAGNREAAAHKLARHFHLANDHAKAFAYCSMAGARSEASYAVDQALDHYGKAMSHARGADGDAVADVCSRMGDLLTLTGRYDDALAMYRQAAPLATSADGSAELSRRRSVVHEKKAEYKESLGELDAAEGLAGLSLPTSSRLTLQRASVLTKMGSQRDALGLALKVVAEGEGVGEAELGNAHHMAGVACWHSGDYDLALDHFAKSLAIREKLGDAQGLASTYNNIGVVNSIRGDWPRAVEHFTKGLELRRKIGDQEGISASHNNLGITHFNYKDASGAIVEFRKSLEIAERIGDVEGAGSTLNNIGNAYIQIGEVERALDAFRRSLEIRLVIGNRRGVAATMNNIGFVLLHRGDIEEAERNLREGLRLREELGDKRGMVTSYENMGRLEFLKGDFAKSEAWYQKTIELCRAIGISDSLAISILGVIEARLAMGRHDGIVELMDESMGVVSGAGFDDFPARLGRTKGTYHASLGNFGESDRAFEESASTFERFLMDVEAAMSKYQWSLVLARRGEKERARAKASSANTVFARKGMRLWERKTREVMDETGSR